MTDTDTRPAVTYALEAHDPASLAPAGRRADVEATIDQAWVGQLAAHAATAETGCGNHTPITIVRMAQPDDQGRTLRVLFGDRRTLGCARAGVPVLGWVAGDEATTKDQMADQLTDQLTENRNRVGWTVADEAAIVLTLFDLKVPQREITKRTGLDKAQIAAARKVAGSELAGHAAARYDLDMIQAGVIAEFDGTENGGESDKDAVAALVKAARERPDQFAHVAQEMRDTAASRAAQARLTAELEAAGYQVTTHSYNYPWISLGQLRQADGKAQITAEEHAACPGRAVRIAQDWAWDDGAEQAYRDKHKLGPDGDIEFRTNEEARDAGYRETWQVITEYCADPDANGHKQHRAYDSGSGTVKPEKGSPEQVATTEANRRKLRRNREWRSANVTRAEWVTAWLTRKALWVRGDPVPKAERAETAALYRAVAMACGETQAGGSASGHDMACKLLGLTRGTGYGGSEPLLAALASASPDRRLVIELGMVLGAAEEAASGGTEGGVKIWQHAESSSWSYYSVPQVARYLAFLEAAGYGLSEVEADVAAKAKPAKKERKPKAAAEPGEDPAEQAAPGTSAQAQGDTTRAGSDPAGDDPSREETGTGEDGGDGGE